MNFPPNTWYMSEVWKIANKCQREVSELKLKLSYPCSKPWNISTQNCTVNFVCTSQERERTDQALMPRDEGKQSLAPQEPAFIEPCLYNWCVDLGTLLEGAPAWWGWELSCINELWSRLSASMMQNDLCFQERKLTGSLGKLGQELAFGFSV